MQVICDNCHEIYILIAFLTLMPQSNILNKNHVRALDLQSGSVPRRNTTTMQKLFFAILICDFSIAF